MTPLTATWTPPVVMIMIPLPVPSGEAPVGGTIVKVMVTQVLSGLILSICGRNEVADVIGNSTIFVTLLPQVTVPLVEAAAIGVPASEKQIFAS